MRRSVALVVAALAAAVAVLLLLLALDVRRYERALADDDSVFRVEPTRADLWQPDQVLPFDLGRRLLGVDDQVQNRRAIRLFALSRPRVNLFEATPDVQQYRSEAAVFLWRRAQNDPDPQRRARILNLLGVLDLISVSSDEPLERMRSLIRAGASFRRSLHADPENEDAKFNLEVSLWLFDRVRSNNPTIKGLGGAATHTDEIGMGY